VVVERRENMGDRKKTVRIEFSVPQTSSDYRPGKLVYTYEVLGGEEEVVTVDGRVEKVERLRCVGVEFVPERTDEDGEGKE